MEWAAVAGCFYSESLLALLVFNVAEAFTAICSWYLTTQEQACEYLLRTS
jgi:hypothetical protein